MQKLAQLKKNLGGGKLAKKEQHTLKNVGGQIVSTLTSRYYKGISANGDNMVIVYEKQDSNNRKP